MRFRTGLLPNSGKNAIVRETLHGGGAELVGGQNYSNLILFVMNQGLSSTCWAHSAAQLKYLRETLLGLPATLSSPLFFAQILYGMYRNEATPAGADLPDLADTGAQLDDAVKAFSQWGSVAFQAKQQDGFTDVPATEDDDGSPIAMPETTFPLVVQASGKLFGGPYDISPGSSAPEIVAKALDRKIPTWLGGPVGQDTMALQAGQIETPTTNAVGGHARSVVGYRMVGSKIQFLILNSWGSTWCDGGYSWAEQEVIEQASSLLPFDES